MFQCDYEDWRLADRCFKDRHKFKKFKVLKRFFKCKDCNERNVTRHKTPVESCRSVLTEPAAVPLTSLLSRMYSDRLIAYAIHFTANVEEEIIPKLV